MKKLTQKEMLELVLTDLGQWCANGDSDCSMHYAYMNGYKLHAANLWMGTGAMSPEVASQVKTLKINRKAELKEIESLCASAFIYECPDCNHHAFLDFDEGDSILCSSCLKTAIKATNS